MGIKTALKKALNFLVPNKKEPDFTSAIIVAGGSSTRLGGGVSKQMLELGGIPVVVRSLLAFENTPEINEIIVVAKADEATLYHEFKRKYAISKLKKVVTGGETRQKSVARGFAVISEKSRYVAVHDGARCLITPEEISAVCGAAFTYGAATAAMKVTDTVKLADKNGFIEKTIDRDRVWLAATPQIFKTEVYTAALALCGKNNVGVTDDNSMAEYIGHPVKLVKCSKDNIKITTKEDVERVSAILKKRVQKGESTQ